jgi:hypothetical protein
MVLIFYIANAVLIWGILAKLRPEKSISGVILFAWNPLVLLLGVSEAYYEIVVITFLLLAALLFQRRSFLLSWVFLLFATLLNVFCLLLLPFFLKLLWGMDIVLSIRFEYPGKKSHSIDKF